jgi:hypothetical protein
MTLFRLALQESLIYMKQEYYRTNSRWGERCCRLGVVAPGVVALCASIELGGRFVSRPCLEHPPKCSFILALWAVNTGSWKSLHAVSFHDLERDVLSGLDVRFFPGVYFDLFSLKATLWASHFLLFSRNRPQACLAFWAKTQMMRTSLYFLTADLIMLRSSLEYSCAEVDAACMTSIGSFLFVAILSW